MPRERVIFSSSSLRRASPLCTQKRTKGFDAGVALRLRQLVLVVGEDQVLAAAVDVQRLPQVAQGHDGALDVPAGAARPPGALPRRLARLRRLPEGKVHRVLFALVDLDPRARLEVVEGASG